MLGLVRRIRWLCWQSPANSSLRPIPCLIGKYREIFSFAGIQKLSCVRIMAETLVFSVQFPKLCNREFIRTNRDFVRENREFYWSTAAVPSIYSIVPPNDGSALRHGHHFEPVDFVIDHGRGHHDAYSAGSCQRTYARACGCRQRQRRHRETLIKSERGWSSRKAFVTMMQTADLGQGNDRSGPGRLNGSSIRCVLAERQVGP